jgi:hypothetical protein
MSIFAGYCARTSKYGTMRFIESRVFTYTCTAIGVVWWSSRSSGSSCASRAARARSAGPMGTIPL